MAAYYNERDPYAAEWLRNLIKAGHIADGYVDDRDIALVQPDDLQGFTQCHFFAGIGGWSLALRLAGWDDARHVWTGSCPCQPFSTAGKGAGTDDARHLWPVWFNLIRQCKPGVVFGEQVEAAINHGWLDLVCADMEGEYYACGPVCIPAGGVGAPHIRQRLWFVADAQRRTTERYGPELASAPGGVQSAAWEQRIRFNAGDGCKLGALAVPDCERFDGERVLLRGDQAGRDAGEVFEAARGGESRQPGHPDHARLEGRRDDVGQHPGKFASRPAGSWGEIEWLPCRDGKTRPTQPGLFPLADGLSGGRMVVVRADEQTGATISRQVSRVGVLRGAGNAIVPQVAAEVIRAYMEVTR